MEKARVMLRAEDAADVLARTLVIKPLRPSHKLRKCGVTVYTHAPTVGNWEGGVIYGDTEDALRIKFRSIAREHLWQA